MSFLVDLNNCLKFQAAIFFVCKFKQIALNPLNFKQCCLVVYFVYVENMNVNFFHSNVFLLCKFFSIHNENYFNLYNII